MSYPISVFVRVENRAGVQLMLACAGGSAPLPPGACIQLNPPACFEPVYVNGIAFGKLRLEEHVFVERDPFQGLRLARFSEPPSATTWSPPSSYDPPPTVAIPPGTRWSPPSVCVPPPITFAIPGGLMGAGVGNLQELKFRNASDIPVKVQVGAQELSLVPTDSGIVSIRENAADVIVNGKSVGCLPAGAHQFEILMDRRKNPRVNRV